MPELPVRGFLLFGSLLLANGTVLGTIDPRGAGADESTYGEGGVGGVFISGAPNKRLSIKNSCINHLQIFLPLSNNKAPK